MRNVYVIDFENEVSDVSIAEGKTYVWLADICNIDTNEHVTVNNIDEFFNCLTKIAPCVCYSHNLKYDGSFILDYLMKNGYKYTDNRKLNEKEFSTLITSMGVFYNITVMLKRGNKKKNLNVEFRDSTKKIPGRVADIAKAYDLPILKGEIDYKQYRPIGYIPSSEEIDYIRNDTEIIARVLKIQYDNEMDKLTSASDTFSKYKKQYTAYFDMLFPVLTYEEDCYIRHAYRGGFCTVNPKFKGKLITESVFCYDVNSMYPYNMIEQLLPYGYPIFYVGEYEENENYPLCIQHILVSCKVKENHPKTILLKNVRFSANEYLDDTKNELIDLYLTNVDMDLLFEHYDIYEIKFVDGYMFRASKNIFKSFIKPIYKKKCETHGAQRQLYKIMLNSLYGKFATNPKHQQKIPYLDEESKLKFTNTDITIEDSIYTAVSAFITAYSRKYLIDIIYKYYDSFIYCDTDSIHLLNTQLPDELIDDKAIGKFKLEKIYKKAKYLGQKCYYGEKDDGKKDVKIAGCPKNITENITFNEFKEGSTWNGKKIPKIINGGAVLVDTTFTLKIR